MSLTQSLTAKILAALPGATVSVEDPNNESLFFGVYCGTNLKVTIDKDDPSKKHRTTCQSKQTIVHDVGSYPFLTMKPSHKDDCPFKPTIKS